MVDFTALGDTVNTAAPLASSAGAAEVLLSEAIDDAIAERSAEFEVRTLTLRASKRPSPCAWRAPRMSRRRHNLDQRKRGLFLEHAAIPGRVFGRRRCFSESSDADFAHESFGGSPGEKGRARYCCALAPSLGSPPAN